MKLHLPKGLFTALLACCSLTTSFVTTVTSATIVVGTVVFTLVPQEAQARIFTWDGSKDGNAHDTENWTTDDGDPFLWSGGGDQGISAAGNGTNILEFSDNGVTNKTVETGFDYLSLGGIVVEAGAEGYVLRRNTSTYTRAVIWNASTAENAATIGGVAGKTNFIIEEDFSLGTTDRRWTSWQYAAGANYDIADTKTLSIVAPEMTINGDAPTDNYEHLVQGGGTLNLNLNSYDLSRSANWTVQENSTIHMSNVAAGGTVTFGALAMNGGNINMGTGNSTLTSQMVVGAAGASITGGDVAGGTQTSLTGRITLTEGGGSLTLNGNFSLHADLEFELLGVDANTANGSYTLLELANGESVLNFNIADLNIVGLLDPLRIESLTWVGNELQLTLADVAFKTVSIASGDLTWDLDAGTTPWMSGGAAASFVDGDVAMIGEGSADGGTITLDVDVSPRTVTVTGEGDWTISGSGSIIAGNLVKEGTGTLTISTSNSYAGGTTLTGGTLILSAVDAAGSGSINMSGADTVLELSSLASLGAASITYSSGTVKYGVGMTDSLDAKITMAAGSGPLTLDINGNDVTWNAAFAGNLSIQNASGADAARFGYAFDMGTKDVTIGTGVTFVSTTSTTAQEASGFDIAGTGTLEIANTGTYTLYATTGFTGTVKATNGAAQVIFNRHNTADDRFMLVTEDAEDPATTTQAIILGGGGWNTGSTLYLSGLSGYSNISVSNNTTVMNRSLDILMTENNSYHGDFHEGNGAGGGRMGTVTIGGAYTFTWTGMTTSGTAYSSIGTNAKLLVQGGTTMNFATNDAGTSGGQWADDITLESGSKLLISRTDATGFVQREAGNEITGAGRIEISGNATLTGANTYTGGTTVTSGGVLTSNSAGALSSGAISVESGGSLIYTAGFTQAAGQTVSNAGSLTLGGALVLNSAITNVAGGTITLAANTIFDLSGLAGDTTGNVTVYTLFENAGTLDYSAVSTDNTLDFSQITGIDTSGLIWEILPDGTIVSTVDANARTYSDGGALTWNTTANDFDGDQIFSTGNDVTFKDNNATVTLGEDITAGIVRVVGIELELDGSGFDLTATRIALQEAATFIQKGDFIAADVDFIGDASNTLIFDLGSGVSITRNDELVEFKGDLIVRSGDLTVNNDTAGKLMDFESMTVEAGASLTTAGVTFAEAAAIPLVLQGGLDATSTATWNTGNATFWGTVEASGNTTINASNVLYLHADVTSNGDLILNGAEHTIQIQEELAGSGTIIKTGTGILDLSVSSGITHTGSLFVGEGSLYLGSAVGYDLTIDVAFDQITMEAGTSLRLGMGYDSNLDSVNLVLKGTQVSHTNLGGGGDNTVQMSSLTIEGDNTFNLALKAGYLFETLSGTGNLEFTGGNTAGNTYNITFDQVIDLGGTVTGVDFETFNLNVGSVHQNAGVAGTIAGSDVKSVSFVKTGDGSLTITESLLATDLVSIAAGDLTVTGNVSTSILINNSLGKVDFGSLTLAQDGTLQMSYGGEMTIGAYTLSGNLRLNYVNMAHVLTLDTDVLNNVTGMYIDLLDYDLADLSGEGINLGIANSYELDKITVLGFEDGEYSITQGADGYLKLTSTMLPDIAWDANWGTAELQTRPISVMATDTLTTGGIDGSGGGIVLYNNAEGYTVGSTTSIELTGGDYATQILVGGGAIGNAGAAITVNTNTWIELSGGSIQLAVGGLFANNWQMTGTTSTFNGNSHILVDGGTVGYVVGGNYREGSHPLFNGDTFISVFTDTVTGSIIGAGTATHNAISAADPNRTSSHVGDTNIYIYTPLTTNSASLDGLGNNIVAGGFMTEGSTTVTFNHTGDTNITIDLSDYTGGEASMSKMLIGAGRITNTSNIYNHTGDTNITIHGHEQVTFAEWIMGGVNHYEGSGTSTIDGDTNITITGDSTFSQRIVGAANKANGTSTLTGMTYIDISGDGIFNEGIIGGFNQHNGTSNLGGTKISIHGGTYNQRIIAGNLQANGTSTIAGDTNLSILAGTFNNAVYGGSVDLNQASSNVTEGSHVVYIAGGTFTGNLVGGSQIAENFSGTLSVAGGVDMDITSGTFDGMIIGGHIRTAGTLASDTSMGAVDINIAGATINGALYAAGHLAATLADGDMSVTASTTVSIASNVTFGADATVSGGFGGAGAASGEVTGDRTLVFGDAASTYDNIADVEFRDFNVIEITAADTTLSYAGNLAALDANLSKTGAGTLQLAAMNHATSLTINEGTVKLAANSQSNSITSINVTSGATLDMTETSTGINGDLTLRGGSSLAITTGVAGAVIGGGSLTLIGAETTRINLNIEGLTYTAGMEITETLFSGILSGDQIDGIDLTRVLDNGMRGILASDYFDTGFDMTNLYIAYDEDNDSLILTNKINATLVWGGGNGAWTGANEWTKNSAPATFNDDDNVIFNASTAELTGTVTVGANVTVSDMTFEGNGSPDDNIAYSFNGARITVEGDLSVLEGASATFSNIELAATDVVIGANSTLSLRDDATVLTLNNAGTMNVGTVGDPRNFSIRTATQTGGNLSVSGNLQLADGANVFGLLSVGGDVTMTGALSMAQGSSITGAFGGTGLAVTGTETASSTTVGSITNALASLTNANGSLTIGSTVSVGEFVNAGHVVLQTADGKKYALTITSATSQGGDITASSLTLAGDATETNTFGVIDISSSVTTDSQLSVEAGSTIGGALTAAALTITGGDSVSTTSIGSVTDDLASLSNGAGTLNVATGDLTVTGSFSNTGTVIVDGTLELDTATTTGGAVEADDVTLAGGDSFTSITTTGAITSTGALSLSEASTAGTLEGVTDLTVETSLDVSFVGANSVNSLAGAGSFTVGGSLRTGAASSIGALTFSSNIYLGGNLTVNSTLTTSTTSMIVNVDYTASTTTPIVSAGSVAGATEIDFAFVDDAYLSGLNMESGATITLLDTLTDTSSITEARINGDHRYSLGTYLYEISIENGDVYLTATLTGNEWVSSTGTWSSGDSWSDDTPDVSKEAIFSGDGNATITIAGDVTALNVLVDVGDAPSVSAYTLTGDGQLTTGEFSLRKGDFIIETQLDIVDEIGGAASTGSLLLSGTSALNVADGGAITAVTASMTAGNTLTVASGASLTVEGALTGADATIANDGMLSVGDGTSFEELTGTGELALAGTVSITTVSGDNITLNAASQLTATTVTLTGSLTGAGSLTATDVTLGTADIGALIATTLTLNEAGNVISTLQANTITFDSALVSGTPLLTVSDVNAITGATIDIDMAGFDATTAIGSYTIIGNGGSTNLSWDSFDLSDADKTSFNDQLLSGKDVVLGTSSTGDLTLTITDADNRIWDTADLFAVTPELENADPSVKIEVIGADGKIVSYYALDSVERVMVTEDVTVDLTALTLEPSETRGLLLKNLGGTEGKTMSIVGNGVDDSLATLFNDADSYAQNGLSVTDATLQVKGESGATLELKSLTMTDSALDVVNGGNMELTEGALTNSSVTVGSGANLSATGEVELTDSHLTVNDGGTASLGDVNLLGTSSLTENTGGSLTVGSLSGGAESQVEGDITVTGSDGSFLGEYVTDTDITVDTGAKQTLAVDANLNVIGKAGAEIILTMDDTRNQLGSLSSTGSKVTLTGNTVAQPLQIEESSAMTAGSLYVSLDSDNMQDVLNGTGGTLQTVMTGTAGSSLTLTGVDIYVSALSGTTDTGVLDLTGLVGTSDLVIGTLHDNLVDGGNNVILDGATLTRFFNNARLENGQIVVDLNTSAYSDLAVTENGAAGLDILSDAVITLNSKLTGSAPEYKDLAGVLKSLDTLATANDRAAADSLAAAVAGSSVTSLGSSMLSSVEQQLRSVRNRTTSMGGNTLAIDGEPVFSAWISAEGSSNTLDNDGTASGHDYNAWGGSLGFFSDVNENLTLGMAFSALHGTLSSDVADTASGDMNTYGVSAYAVVLDKRWSHTFIATASLADATLDRTISHANGSYKTSGDTDGYGLGLMYEVGYTYGLSETTSWQPIFNVALVHAQMNGYTESSHDAGLTVGDQTNTYVTFGLGGRIETTFGENIVNRKAVLSARALAKLDAGDRYTEADVELNNNSAVNRTIRGAEAGAFGVEVGAGLKVPVGMEASVIFIDAGLELRSGMNNINASAGYQMQF